MLFQVWLSWVMALYPACPWWACACRLAREEAQLQGTHRPRRTIRIHLRSSYQAVPRNVLCQGRVAGVVAAKTAAWVRCVDARAETRSHVMDMQIG